MSRQSSATDPFEDVNKRIWSDSDVVREFAVADGYLDEGESACLAAARDLAAGPRVLDIGVGAGRTVPGLAGGLEYVGIDVLPEMVRACKLRYPDVDVRLGDARRLEFEDRSFDLVVFSNNGIDAMGNADRQQVLREVRRVLVPGGVLAFSTYNLEGPSARERPWTFPGLDWRKPRRSLARIRYRLRGLRRGIANYRRLAAKSFEKGDGWEMRINGSHAFGIIVHHTTLAHQFVELERAGFEVAQIWSGNDGRPLARGSSTRDVWYFHIVCRAGG